PKNNDYAMVKGAMRNIEPWRERDTADETIDEKLDRLEKEEAEAAGEEEKNAMEELEAKNADAKREMAAADALDEIRQRNARIHRSEKQGMDYADEIIRAEDEVKIRLEQEDDDAAKKAFAEAKARLAAPAANDEASSTPTEPTADLSKPALAPDVLEPVPESASEPTSDMPPPSFKRVVKKKKDRSALLGIKKKPSLV
ncbi:hypothetical protein Golomagni_08152, partial [Golovinomyces magnicellulatus]